MESASQPHPASTPSATALLVISSLLATGLTLYLALRLESSAVWLLVPIALLALRRRPPSEYGLDLRFSPPTLLVQTILATVLFVLYAVAHAAVAGALLGLDFTPHWPRENPLLAFVRELLVVGIPEEVFFRGFLQTELDRALPYRRRLLGAEVGPGVVLQALLFGLCHLIGGDWTQLRTVAFGLLVGWLRARSGSVAMPAVYHALANLWYRALGASFR